MPVRTKLVFAVIVLLALTATMAPANSQQVPIKPMPNPTIFLSLPYQQHPYVDNTEKEISYIQQQQHKLAKQEWLKRYEAEQAKKAEQERQMVLASRGSMQPVTSAPSEPMVVATYAIRATAYGTSEQNGGNGSGRTATGTRPVEGRTIAVDPNVIPLGSKVKIMCPSYPSINGIYTAEDVGGAIHGSRIDIYMDDSKRQRMLEFGIRNITASVLR